MIFFLLLGLIIIFIILWDGFETIVLPRRVNRKLRFARIFYRTIWRLWVKQIRHIRSESAKESFLGIFGPLSLILLLAIWAIALVIGFALINFGLRVPLTGLHGDHDFLPYIYASGATFFPLGFPDIAPIEIAGRVSFIIEAATGFGFLAIVIGYLPTLYQAFSQREIHINLLDARAGSPPSAFYLLKQYSGSELANSLKTLLEEWEVWCAELLETHLSYPVLAYYRSQHENQSWLAALAMILDTSALLLVGIDGISSKPAKFTFAIACHVAVDLTQVFYLTPIAPVQDRLSKEDFQKLKAILKQHGVLLKNGEKTEKTLRELRELYEPYIQALSQFFHMPIPIFVSEKDAKQAWRTTPWKK